MPGSMKNLSGSISIEHSPAFAEIFSLRHCQNCVAGVIVDLRPLVMDKLAHPSEQRHDASGTGFPAAQALPLVVLHVDDDAKDHALFKAASSEANVPIVWHYINSAQGTIAYLQRLLKAGAAGSMAWPDLILLDVAMPGECGLKVLEYTCTKPEFQKLPIIVFSGSKDPKITARAGRLGAKSVVAKPLDFAEAVQIIDSLYRLFSVSAYRRTHVTLPA